MPVNASPEYGHAEKEYHLAQTLEEKIEKLRKMLSLAPKHKSSENLVAQLRTRLKKFLEQQEKAKKSGKSSRIGIKKSEMQAVIVGFTNAGKSSLLSTLTNAHPEIYETKFTTIRPIIGMMSYQGTQIQLIEIPAIDSDFYDRGIVHTADSILILIRNLEELKKIEPVLPAKSKRIIVVTKSDLLSELEKRKLEATLKSKYKNYEFVFISAKKELEERAISRDIITKSNLKNPSEVGSRAISQDIIAKARLTRRHSSVIPWGVIPWGNLKDSSEIASLKEKIFKSFNKIRVYTKEPRKEKSENPIILEPETTVKKVAEKILKGFSEKVKETRIWGPSSKFSGQKVGLQHKLKDLDVVEFKTR